MSSKNQTPDIQDFPCPICNKSNPTEAQLINHVDQDHPEVRENLLPAYQRQDQDSPIVEALIANSEETERVMQAAKRNLIDPIIEGGRQFELKRTLVIAGVFIVILGVITYLLQAGFMGESTFAVIIGTVLGYILKEVV